MGYRGVINAALRAVPALACAAWLGASAVSANAQTPPLGTDPVWESGPANLTRAVVLGDIDRDGHLDLVCGTLAGPNTLFAGTGRFFTSSSTWSPASVSTESLALGDIDGDGDLDLVCGNVGANTVYTNDGGVLSTTPSQTLPGTSTTTGVALGDIDGDGDLDLVCANDVDGVSVYLNNGGVFETPAAWSSTRNRTTSVALGDVNRDGVLDLVCGNRYEENTLYLGANGLFGAQPAWTSDSTLSTSAVRLGDIDGDGALDLVCANEERVTLYRNLGTALDTIPSWTATPGVAGAVDLGDADGDGDLDVAVGVVGGPDVLYRNDGGALTAVPVWFSGRSNDDPAIAFADVDGDGDLDLVCGNSNQTNTVYENVTPPLPATPDWSAGTTLKTLAIDVGDVTGDGRVDLVCGILGSNALFAGGGTPFELLPSWQSLASEYTSGVVLGDIDGDGDLDLVCGNATANTAYTNIGGVLSLSWTSSVSDKTTDVALGDIDGDGALDLVCANASGANTMYLNTGTALATTPAWQATSDRATGVALGDIDGDGDLDVVFANTDNTPNTAYENVGGTFAANPAWTSGPANRSGDVALGDVDGDGIVDAVFGNLYQANTLYLHAGSSFDATPAWSSGLAQVTACVALGDVDGDGDLDLVCGNVSQPNTMYLNTGGVFSTTTAWASADTASTEDIALADIDGDGDLDLVCGNELSPNTAYLGRRNPPYRYDTTAPTHQTPNEPAYLSRVAVTEPGVNHRTVHFALVDIGDDPVWVLAEYQFEGDPTWYRADTGLDGLAGPFASSPTGAVDSLDWDVTRIAFDRRRTVLRLKAIETPARAGLVRAIPSYTVDVGRITPARAEIHTGSGAVAFSTVTQGDTASAVIPIENRGTVDLVVDNIALPSPEMRSDAVLPMVVAPGAVQSLHLFLEPITETSVAGPIAISSNDVLTPVADIAVSADIRALAATTRLLAAAPTIPLGEAATVVVEPLPQVHVEGGTLYHRAAGAGTFDAIPLGRSGNDFVAVIPGAAVVEGGIEYYVEVDNAPVASTDPPGAPGDSVFFQSVASPTAVTSTPRPTVGESFGDGVAIRVNVHLPQGAVFSAGTLHYREGGGASFGAEPLVLDGGAPEATIPDSVVTARGVEYYVDVQTTTSSITDPTTGPTDHPNTIRVLVPNLLEPGSHPGGTYRLFSVPLDMQGPILGSIADELGGTDNTQWRLFGYDAAAGHYNELPRATETRFTPGKAYWLIARERNRIGTGAENGLSTPTAAPFEVTLQPGYNLVSSPFDFDVAWDSCFVDTLAVADTLSSAVVNAPVAWLQSGGYAFDIQVLRPFAGYWIKNRTAAPVVLKIPPRAAPPAAPTVAATATAATAWTLTVRASAADTRAVDATGAATVVVPAILGVDAGASDGWDALDRAMPPLPPGRGIAVYFPHDGDGGARSTDAHDVRAALAPGHVWRFDVAKSYTLEGGGDDVVVTVEGVDALAPELRAVLVDRVLGRVVDLSERTALDVILGERAMTASESDARFAVVVGSREYVDAQSKELAVPPRRTALFQNHPNPFNPHTVIRYDLEAPARVSLRIYDVSGALVRVLDDRSLPAGRYEVGWDGADAHGTSVASGVYFYCLTAGTFRATRKMVLLK